MTRKMCMICDICGELIADETKGFEMMIRRVTQDNAISTNESYDVCPACKDTLESWIKGRKEPVITAASDIPIINKVV